MQNLRYALRRLAQRPGFALVAILSLALGIGANTAIFSLVNAILLKEKPFEKPEELVEVYLSSPDFEYNAFSYPDFDDFVDGTRGVFQEVSGTRLAITQADGPDGSVATLPAEVVTGNYFTTLGIEAALGRVLLPEDDVAPGAHPVVVLGHGYWQSRFGGDPLVVGKDLRLGGRPYTIVGVLPEAYAGHFRGIAPAFFAPRMMVNELMPGDDDQMKQRGNHSVFVQARLAPGATLTEAKTVVDALTSELNQRAVEDWDTQSSFLLVPTLDVVLFPPMDRFVRAAAWLLMAVVGLVLLMSCANLASFLLARALDRRKEIALRLALGASRRHLVAQLLTETTLLGLAGGVAGIALGVGLLRILTSADLPLPLPISLDLRLDATVLGFGLALSLAAGLLLGLLPALQTTRPDISATIKDESAGVGRSGRFTLRNALVVVQVATSLVLLVGAGLFLRSLQRVQTVDPGFGREPAGILSVLVPSTRYSEAEAAGLVERLEERFRGLPGVRAVGTTDNLNLNTLNTQNIDFNVDGVEPPEGRESQLADRASVSPGFFDAVGIRLVEGRNFDSRDQPEGQAVAIVSEVLAKTFFPRGNAVGSLLRRPGEDDDDLLVVGVATDAKVRSLGEAPRAFVYRPLSQTRSRFLTLVAETRVEPEQTALGMMAAARELDPKLWIWEAKTMARHIGIMLLPARLSAMLLSAFAALALALASIGLYGVVSYAVAQRTREVGIRMSLGANAGSVVGMLMSSGLRLVAVGAVVGVAISLLLAPAIASLLFGVEPVDVVAFTSMPFVLLAAAVLAAYVPARRASRIDPVRALRME